MITYMSKEFLGTRWSLSNDFNICNYNASAGALFKAEESISVFKTHLATRGAVNFYSAGGVVTHDRRIGFSLIHDRRIGSGFFSPLIIRVTRCACEKINQM
jgi:hypothetical protein